MLKDVRIKNGLSQKELAIKSGYSQQAISKYEVNGISKFETALTLARVLGVKEKDIFKEFYQG